MAEPMASAFYHALVESLPQNILRKDLEGRFTFANSRCCQTLGWSLDNLLGKTDFDLFPKEIAQRYLADDHRVIATGQNHEAVETHQATSGTMFVQVIKTPLRDATGAIIGTQCIFWDVTDREIMEEQLHYERELLRALLDACPDCIYFKDDQSRFLRVSRSLSARAGLADPEDAVGKTDFDFFDKDHAQAAFDDERRILSGGAPVIAKTEREVWADGRETWTTTTKMPLTNKTGTIVGTFGVSRDVTQLKRAEAEQRKLEVSLRQAQKLESIGRLAAGVAHEINTPVQFISDSVHFVQEAVADLLSLVEKYHQAYVLVLDGHSPDVAVAAVLRAEHDTDLGYLTTQVPRALERSLEGLDRVASIVRSMKEFANPDETEMTKVDLNKAIENTLTVARNEYAQVADVEMALGDIPLVTCHGSEVNQALLNVLVNAAHAISDVVAQSGTRGRIVVRTRSEADSVVIEIADNGSGIPDAIRDRVFDPFFTTKEVGRGTGQGLAIARNVITEKHGGEITFDTAAGRGTTFSLRLPIENSRRPELAA